MSRHFFPLENGDEQPTAAATFFNCGEACGGWIDMRDLGVVLDHEGPMPHSVEEQAQ